MNSTSGCEHMLPAPAQAGGDAAHALGAGLVAAVDLDAIAARIAQLPTAALLGELEAVVAAVDSGDPARSRRRAGWWGRLLGRDLVAQAQPDPIEQRIRLRLAAAQTHADALVTEVAALEPLAASLQEQIARLEALLERERRASNANGDASDATQLRRLSHLDAIAASWRATVAQIALIRTHAVQLLARHAQVRDLLLTLRRERNAAQATGAQLDHDHASRLQTALRELHTAASSFTVPHAHADRPPQEPSS